MQALFQFSFLGLPLMMWGGMGVLGLALLTGFVGYLINKGKFANLKVHKGLAATTIIAGLLHFSFSLYFYLSR